MQSLPTAMLLCVAPSKFLSPTPTTRTLRNLSKVVLSTTDDSSKNSELLHRVRQSKNFLNRSSMEVVRKENAHRRQDRN